MIDGMQQRRHLKNSLICRPIHCIVRKQYSTADWNPSYSLGERNSKHAEVDSYNHLPVDPAAARQEMKLSEVVSKHSSTGEGAAGKQSPRLEGLLHTDKQLSNAANG